jgi:hypothetical protein
MSLLILPGTELYADTLANSHVFMRLGCANNPQNAQIQDVDTGLYRDATIEQVFEYAYGGEYDDVLEKYGD